MSMWKRAIALGMTMGMLISSMPVSAYADEMIVEDDFYVVAEDDTEAMLVPEIDVDNEDIFDDSFISDEEEAGIEDVLGITSEETEEEILYASNVNTDTSGTCGDNLTWTLDAAGTLTISGTGAMDTYGTPWDDDGDAPSSFSCRTDIKKIVVENGVSSIGSCAFCSCTAVTSVLLPTTIEKIGMFAFERCSSLTTINIPYGVTDLYGVFEYCTSLKSITIPSSVTVIEDYDFYYCTSLTSITIPSSVTVITDIAFDGCDQLTIYGHIGSYAESYALEHGIPFIALDNSNPYNMRDETYSFDNYADEDADGHCFGMSITSAGYYNNLLDIANIGGNANTPLYSFDDSFTVREPICHYQRQQGNSVLNAIVAGGAMDKGMARSILVDWYEVVNFVKCHEFDGSGLLQIGFAGKYYAEGKQKLGWHAINFLRYENVNGQDRIYAYDCNYPDEETYFYQDAMGRVFQAPEHTFIGAIDCIELVDIRQYFNNVKHFDPTHALYMKENAAIVQGYTYTHMKEDLPKTPSVMYEIPSEVDSVTIIPKTDNASIIYMDKEYKFGDVTEDTCAFLTFAIGEGTGGGSDEVFEIHTHTWDSGKVTKAATVTAAGIKTFTCTDCGETKTETIPKLSPSDDNPQVNPGTDAAPEVIAEQITISKKPTIKKPSATKNKITVNWKHFKHTSKKTKAIWKKIKKVEVQCATDKAFTNIVKTTTVGKSKTKATIKGLAKKTNYYVRVRYFDGTGYSKWSSVKKIKTKK